MNFRDYKWFNNPRGLRNNGPYTALNPDRYSGPRMGWAKLVVGGTEHVEGVLALLARGCMPIVQIYRERMGASPADEEWYAIYEKYHKAGVMWFELYDEPNSEQSWPSGTTPDWANRDVFIAPLMDHWLDWAERIAAMGAYPAFPAMAATAAPQGATLSWTDACLSYLEEAHAARFSRLIANGMWCATHPYLLNHFYQEPPGGAPSAARPYYQQSYKESGWHFEYPYDPLQQHDDPGRTPLGGTGSTPHGDPNGLIAAGEIFTELLRRKFAAGPVPVIGTAGGIWPIPTQGADPIQADSRYYGYSRDSHAEATLALFRWLAEQGPPWLFGLALSSEDDYYGQGAAAPAIELLLGEPPVMKEPPDLDITPGKAAASMPEPEMSGDPFSMETGPETPSTEPQEETPPADMETFLADLDMGFTEEQVTSSGQESPAEAEPESPEPEAEPSAEMDMEPGEPEPSAEAEEESAEPWPPVEPEESTEPKPILEAEPPPPVMTLKEHETPVTTLMEQEQSVTTLAEHEEPVTTLTATEQAASEPELEHRPEREEKAPPPTPEVIAMPATSDEETASEEDLGPVSVMWPAPEAHEEVEETAPPEPEPEPAPEPVLEEVPPVEPEPGEFAPDEARTEEEFGPVTVLWPAPEAHEEVEGAEAAAPPPAVVAEKLGPGPGPAYDIITYHWLMPAPDLPPGWLLSASRGYWEVFHTPIVSDASLIGAVPPDKSLAITLVASRAGAEAARAKLAAEWPNVRVDVVVGDTAAEIRAELDRRAQADKEFG